VTPPGDVIQIGSLYEKRDGNWSGHAVLVAEPIVLRTKFGAVVIAVNGVVAPAKPPPETKWFKDAISDDVIADVLTYLRAKPDWFELYKAYESMRDDINRKLGGQHQLDAMGWPGKAELDYFTESATVHRHSPPKWGRLNPTTTMKIDEARSFIRRLAQTWLGWRPNDPP
jgi:hypothetical protein